MESFCLWDGAIAKTCSKCAETNGYDLYGDIFLHFVNIIPMHTRTSQTVIVVHEISWMSPCPKQSMWHPLGFRFQRPTAMAMIQVGLLYAMLATLSTQELRDVYGFVKLDMPWVLVELVIHAMIARRAMDFEVPQDLRCVEFFAGSDRSSQIAKAFTELGFAALAFDLLRNLAVKSSKTKPQTVMMFAVPRYVKQRPMHAVQPEEARHMIWHPRMG